MLLGHETNPALLIPELNVNTYIFLPDVVAGEIVQILGELLSHVVLPQLGFQPLESTQ